MLLERDDLRRDPLARELVAVLTCPTGTSSAGWPYLVQPAWERLRDWVPHLLGAGPRAWDALERVERAADALGLDVGDAARVVRQVLRTAAITAPAELWLLRHVLSTLRRLGLLDRLAAGEGVVPGRSGLGLHAGELRVDLELLLARGYLVRSGDELIRPDGHTARRVLSEVEALPDLPTDLAARWASALDGGDGTLLAELWADPPEVPQKVPPRWVAAPEEIELGWRLVPLVLGLRAAGRIGPLLDAGRVSGADLVEDPALARAVDQVLAAAGVVDPAGAVTPLGRRVLERGPGPFGIIETYHPYLARLEQILREGRAGVWVERGANVAASQDANARTFRRANDALDRFCDDTGFSFGVYVEHAVGRGEAIRQRFARSGPALRYVGADLEEAALQAARAERDEGRLPGDLLLVRADIGDPAALVDALTAAGVDPEGAVMVVGNGLHEVREQTDERMVEVFRGYERAGLLLLFTEESALPVDDLLQTAWNTYHAAFRYVHERSGQGLRPASSTPPSRFGSPVATSWTECATAAGYVRADAWCSRGRTIHPYPPANGSNPAVSVNHFFVPGRIARRLGLGSTRG